MYTGDIVLLCVMPSQCHYFFGEGGGGGGGRVRDIGVAFKGREALLSRRIFF